MGKLRKQLKMLLVLFIFTSIIYSAIQIHFYRCSSDPLPSCLVQPFKNQNELRTRATTLLLDYENYVPWNRNITFNVRYWDFDINDNITGTTINASIIKITNPATGEFWDDSNFTQEFGDFTGNITIFPETLPNEGYNVTMNTGWLFSSSTVRWRLEANKSGYDDASTEINVIVRDLKAEIEILNSPVLVDADVNSHFNITLNYWDREINAKIRNDTSDPRYDGIHFGFMTITVTKMIRRIGDEISNTERLW